MARPPGLAYWLDGTPNLFISTILAYQHQGIQSIYFVLPVAVAGAVTQDPVEITRYLGLSLLAAAIWQVLQLLTRGPLGSGYPIPATHTATCLGAYMLTAHAGGGFGAMAAMVCLMGIASFALTFAMRRLRVVLPNEVAGVVVLLIGVALIDLAVDQMGLEPGGTPRDAASVMIVLASMAAMMAVALSKTRLAPVAVLIGAKLGVGLCLLFGEGVPNAKAFVAAQPWLAWPHPFAPDFSQVRPAPMLAFLLAIVATQATTMGAMVVMQRAADANWTKPDTAPLHRGLLANALGLVVAGLIGGAAPGPATAAVGLSIATGTLARRIVWIGSVMLAAMAFSPKIVALFVLVPAPVNAAMLLYVAGFIMAQGCQLATARLLDTRRMIVVAFGLGAGILVTVAPQRFLTDLPAIASPLSFGAVVAFLINLVTLPLVARRAERSLPLDTMAARLAAEWFGTLAGSWGLKEATAQAADRALVELTELLTARAVPTLGLLAWRSEDRVGLSLRWQGERLPDRPVAASTEDLLGSVEAQERFIVWLATNGVLRFTQRTTEQACEAQLVFDD